MDRRGFLRAILAAGAAPAIVRASSLMKVTSTIMPGFDPLIHEGNWVATEAGLLTPAMITREALRILHQNLEFADAVNVDYDPEWKQLNTLFIRRHG